MKKVLHILGILDDDDIDWMMGVGTKREFRFGDKLIEEGTKTDEMFIILDGQVNVTVHSKKVAKLGSGEIVGEMSFLDTRPSSATVSALEDVTVLQLDYADLQARLNSNPYFKGRFFHALYAFLTQRLRSLNMSMVSYDTIIVDQDALEEGELDPETLEMISIAGARFRHMIQKLTGHER